MDNGVVARDTRTGLELVEACVRVESVEDLSGIGQIDAKVGDAWVSERHQVCVDDPVSLLDEMRDRMPTRLAATTSEEDSHLTKGTDSSLRRNNLMTSPRQKFPTQWASGRRPHVVRLGTTVFNSTSRSVPVSAANVVHPASEDDLAVRAILSITRSE